MLLWQLIGYSLTVVAKSQGTSLRFALEKLSTIRVPHGYGPLVYKYDRYDSKALAFDAERKILYSVGYHNIHVVNMTDPTNLQIVYHKTLNRMYMTDVEFCGGYVFITMDNYTNRENGVLNIYERYNETTYSLKLVHSIKVGVEPDMVLPTLNCSRVVVAIEGEPYQKADKWIDPEGGIAIIKFQDTLAGPYTMTKLDFTEFNNRVEALEEDGVRFVNKENGNTFANDVEPEYIAFNTEETEAFICLQENNAIAIVDLLSEKIISIHGLGFKDWRHYKMDPSDKDGGINLKSWPVYGMYQPDAIKFMTIRGVEYIVTANEGDSKDNSFYSEEQEVRDFNLSSLFEIDPLKRQELKTDHQLGRLEVSKENGLNATTGKYDALYTFGARSFSIWFANNMSLVYDSGDDISTNTSVLFPELFNCDTRYSSPLTGKDKRSDNTGPETESLEIVRLNGYTLIVVGNEKPGTLSLYSIDETKPALEPKFEGMFHDIHRLDDTWENLVSNGDISMLGPEDIKFIPAHNSPNGEPLVLATGTVSGTVTLFKIKSIPDVTVSRRPSVPVQNSPNRNPFHITSVSASGTAQDNPTGFPIDMSSITASTVSVSRSISAQDNPTGGHLQMTSVTSTRAVPSSPFISAKNNPSRGPIHIEKATTSETGLSSSVPDAKSPGDKAFIIPLSALSGVMVLGVAVVFACLFISRSNCNILHGSVGATAAVANDEAHLKSHRNEDNTQRAINIQAGTSSNYMN